MTRPRKIHAPLQMGFTQVLTGIADQQKPETQTVGARPFLKWVGGKRSILPELERRMPEQYGTYHEPFLGGGALFFAVQPAKAYLSDINFLLIITFTAVRDDVEKLIELLRVHEKSHSPAYYARARIRVTAERDATAIASLFIYLNKTCFNGLYRVNKAGQFNVPIGSYDSPSIFDETTLRNDSALLQGVTIMQHDFSHLNIAREDFFYLDPPYHKTYSQYDGSGFGEDKHTALATFCREIHESGAFFMLSNSDTPFVRSLYKGFEIDRVSASRSVSCKAHQRGKENELLIKNYD